MGILRTSEEYKNRSKTQISDRPWFVQGAIKYLEKILTKNTIAMEYGSGGSTRWFAQRVMKITSIEHNKRWYDRVYNYIIFNDIKNVNLKYIDLYHGYAKVIDNMGKFDFISIDGRRRSECIQYAHTHVNIGGYILLNDAERKHYHPAIKSYLVGWKRCDFHNGKLTSIFQKFLDRDEK